MTPDNSTRRPAAAAGRGADGRFAAGPVLVADGDPDVTDDIARTLRDRYTIRTAYSGPEALASLDAEIAVALLDPGLLEVRTERIADRTGGCRLAALVDADADAVGAPFDECLRKPVSEPVLRETVAALCRRASYRCGLDEYYELATALAGTDEADPECERLERRLEELRAELDAVLDGLDRDAAFEAALDESGE